MANHASRGGVGENVRDLRCGEPYVQRHRGHSQPGTRVNELDVVGFVREQQRQPVSHAKTVSSQGCRNASNAIMKLTKRRALAGSRERRPFRIETSAPAERMKINHPFTRRPVLAGASRRTR